MKGYAPLIRSAIASLQAGIPDAIAAFNLEPENAVALTVPLEEAYYFGGEDPLTLFPSVEVTIPTGAGDAVSLGQTEWDVSAQVFVVVWVDVFELAIGEATGTIAAGEVSRLYEAALGYGRVAKEILMMPGAFGDHVTVSRYADRYGANPEAQDLPRFRMGAVMVFDLDDLDKHP